MLASAAIYYCRGKPECKADGAQKPEFFSRVLTLRTLEPLHSYSPGLQPGVLRISSTAQRCNRVS